jgi:anti-anti-sigma factor
MKRDPTSSTASHSAANRGNGAALADPIRASTSLSEAMYARPHLTLGGPPVWRHKLILTGKLDHGSASELDEEIECLCQEGVTVLTLDLRQLDAIDSTGVAAIAFRGAVCKRLGSDFAVIPGSHVVRRALAEAGATDLLTPDPDQSVVRRFPSRAANGSWSERSTTMIKSL